MSQQEYYSEDIKVNNPFGVHWLDASPRKQNKTNHYPEMCTRAQAKAFYASLGDFQQMTDDIQAVKDAESLKALSGRADNWYQRVKPDSYVLMAELAKLDRHLKHSLIEHMTGGTGDNPEPNALRRTRALATDDLKAIQDEAIPDRDLRINRAIVEKTLCSDRRALEFYDTWEELMWDIVDKTPAISDRSSLKAWAIQFHAWRKKTWASFYAEPCGATAYFMDVFESCAYNAALAHLTDLGEAVLKVISAFLDDMVDYAIDDSVMIED